MALVPINNFRDYYSMDFRYTGQNMAVLFFLFNLQLPEEPIPIFVLNNRRAPPNPNAPPGTHNGYITMFSEAVPQASHWQSAPGFLAATVRWWLNAMHPPQLQVRHGGDLVPHTMDDLVPLRFGSPGTLSEVRALRIGVIEYEITPAIDETTQPPSRYRNVWYRRGTASRRCAIITRGTGIQGRNYFKIYIADNSNLRLEGEPVEVMGNLRIHGTNLRLLLAAMVLEVPAPP